MRLLETKVCPPTRCSGAGGVMLPNHSPRWLSRTSFWRRSIRAASDVGIGRAPDTDGLTALALHRSREAVVADDFLNQLGELIAWGNGRFWQIIPSGGRAVSMMSRCSGECAGCPEEAARRQASKRRRHQWL